MIWRAILACAACFFNRLLFLIARLAMTVIRITDLGLIEYAAAWEKQKTAAAEAAAGGLETLFLLEHPPTITFGRNGGEEHLPFPRLFFEERGIALVRSSRGGSITCHFPGQLVAYPVLRLDRRPGGLRRFFYDLEESVIRTLACFGVSAGREEERPGVWTGGRKICSIGIAVKHWISTHGLSLNLIDDGSLFDLVTPCGLPGVKATSLHQESGSKDISMKMLKGCFAREFRAVFGLTPPDEAEPAAPFRPSGQAATIEPIS